MEIHVGLSSDLESLPLVVEPAAETVIESQELLSLIQILTLNLFWFGYQFFWFLVLIVLLPKQIKDIMGDDLKGTGMSIVSLVSGAFNLFLAVIFGALNDRFNSKWGKRRPWMVVGSLGMCVFLYGLWPFDAIWVYTLGYLGLTISSILSSVPFNGFVADVTPLTQKGTVSAIMGSMNLAGYLAAAIVGAFVEDLGYPYVYLLMSLILISSTLWTIFSVPEPKKHMTESQLQPIHWPSFFRDLVRPLYMHRNFRLVFMGRFLAQLGISTVQQFLQYWIEDCIKDSGMSATRSVSLAMIPLLTISPIAALFIPKTRRKIVVYISTFLMVATCIIMMLTRTYLGALFVSAIFGLGYGPYISCEFAMLLDVLPNAEGTQSVAKDISLWHSAIVLPQIIATPLAGWIRDGFESVGKANGIECLGYKIIFAICIVYFLAGAEMTRRIQGMA